jgi:hypothetical protein
MSLPLQLPAAPAVLTFTQAATPFALTLAQANPQSLGLMTELTPAREFSSEFSIDFK